MLQPQDSSITGGTSLETLNTCGINSAEFHEAPCVMDHLCWGAGKEEMPHCYASKKAYSATDLYIHFGEPK